MGILISDLAVPEWETYSNPNPTEAELGLWREDGFYLAEETDELVRYVRVEVYTHKFSKEWRKKEYPASLHLHYTYNTYTDLIFNKEKQTMRFPLELSCNTWLYVIDRMRELGFEERDLKNVNLDGALADMGLILEEDKEYIVAYYDRSKPDRPCFVHFSPYNTKIAIYRECTLTELLVILHKQREIYSGVGGTPMGYRFKYGTI